MMSRGFPLTLAKSDPQSLSCIWYAKWMCLWFDSSSTRQKGDVFRSYISLFVSFVFYLCSVHFCPISTGNFPFTPGTLASLPAYSPNLCATRMSFFLVLAPLWSLLFLSWFPADVSVKFFRDSKVVTWGNMPLLFQGSFLLCFTMLLFLFYVMLTLLVSFFEWKSVRLCDCLVVCPFCRPYIWRSLADMSNSIHVSDDCTSPSVWNWTHLQKANRQSHMLWLRRYLLFFFTCSKDEFSGNNGVLLIFHSFPPLIISYFCFPSLWFSILGWTPTIFQFLLRWFDVFSSPLPDNKVHKGN